MILLLAFACQQSSVSINVGPDPKFEQNDTSIGSQDTQVEETDDTPQEDTREEQSDEFWIEGCEEDVLAGTGQSSGVINCSNGICDIDEGQTWVGSPEGSAAECPVKQVSVSAYGIDAKEVQMSAYEECIHAGACNDIPIDCRVWLNGLEGSLTTKPVVCVTWSQAKAYCQFRNGRLPTEAEWERAARGDDGAIYPWGSDESLFSCQTANIRMDFNYCKPGVTDVGFYQSTRSPYGLWDTMGNVWEWVNDSFDALYYAYGPDIDPTGPTENCQLSEYMPPSDCTRKVIKGGAYNTKLWPSRASVRSSARPSVYDLNIGFRCAYDRN